MIPKTIQTVENRKFPVEMDRKKQTLIPSGLATAAEEEDALTAHDRLRGSCEEERKGIEEDEEE